MRNVQDEISKLVDQILEEFALKDPGEINYFLGVQVKHNIEGIHLSQSKNVSDLLAKTNM